MAGGVTFEDSFLPGSGNTDDDSSGHLNLSSEFNTKYGRPVTRPSIEKDFTYKVVGRLSRWEGGNSTPYQQGRLETGPNGDLEDDEPEKVTFTDFLKQFLKPSYDLTEVTIEDIERVKLMHDRFMGDAQFSFNYSTLLVIASVIAGVGLGSNSTASIIASMLVSPLMGPVTAIAYGISIGDFKMVRMAFVTEVGSLMICILIGLITAGCMLSFQVADNWPTSEMTSRGTMTNFYCGIPIAFFSGLGVAVGILDSQTNSLVGVAISASLLPPAVNAGMLLVIETRPEFRDGEWSTAAFISLGLTVMNIVVIIMASMFMFRLKETLPIKKSIFWADLGVARKIYHNVAIFPHIQEAPSNNEIKKRVTTFFPRASAMPMPSNRDFSSDSGRTKEAWKNSSVPRDSTLGWSDKSTGTAGDNSVEAVRGHNDGLGVMESITEGQPVGNPMDYLTPIAELQ